jgi:nucleotide-binding universal stress UspA family protein
MAGMNFADLKLILVPTDFSESSEAALRTAIQFAKAFHAAIEVFHVDVDPSIVLPPPLDTITLPRLFERVVAETASRLEAIVAEVRKAGVTCTSAEEFGRSHAAIVERARVANVGLIVMGHHGTHTLLAGVAEKVVQHASCAVLVVPTAPRA